MKRFVSCLLAVLSSVPAAMAQSGGGSPTIPVTVSCSREAGPLSSPVVKSELNGLDAYCPFDWQVFYNGAPTADQSSSFVIIPAGHKSVTATLHFHYDPLHYAIEINAVRPLDYFGQISNSGGVYQFPSGACRSVEGSPFWSSKTKGGGYGNSTGETGGGSSSTVLSIVYGFVCRN